MHTRLTASPIRPMKTQDARSRLIMGIGQLFVIVLGVTIALGADAWRESVVERRLEESFLDRLVLDLELQLDEFAEAKTETEWVMAHGLAVLPYVSGKADVGSPIGVLASAYQASRSSATIELVDHTYVELLSTGGLGLISSPQIRTAVVNFYRRYDYGRPDALRASHNAGYYNAVRARIPVEIQRRIRATRSNANGTLGCDQADHPLGCMLEVDTGVAADAAAALVDPEVAMSLNLWLQSQVNELDIADIYAVVVRDVLRVIEENR